MLIVEESTPVLQDSWAFSRTKDPATGEEKLVSMMTRCNICGVQFLREHPITEPRIGGFQALPGGYEVVCKNDDEFHVFYVKDEFIRRT